jgi:pimeloyl-ACP methyl ester carboxylesterase
VKVETTMEQKTMVEINKLKIELIKKGQGDPMVVLHDSDGPNGWPLYLEQLSQQYEVWAPTHPGYGRSEITDEIDSMEDMVYFYQDFLDTFDLKNVTLMGMGMGGWIAAEIAVRNQSRLKQLILVDAVGIKVSARDVVDIVDTFTMPWEEKVAMEWYDPTKAEAFFKNPFTSEEEQLQDFLRGQESTVLLTWKPFMHNPKLRRRLHRIRIPAAIIWGENDRVVKPSYGQVYASELPNAAFYLIEKAGHFPYLEQPELFLKTLKSI